MSVCACDKPSVRFGSETNHSVLCIRFRMSISYLRYTFICFRYFSNGIFYGITVWKILSPKKRKRKHKSAKNLLEMSHYTPLPHRSGCFRSFLFLIFKLTTHVYICVRLRKIIVSLRLSCFCSFIQFGNIYIYVSNISYVILLIFL